MHASARPVSTRGPAARPPADAVIATLVAEHQQFRRFLLRQVGNAADADDILQRGLLTALRREQTLRRGERAVAWFYRILRNAVADHFRARAAERRRAERLQRLASDEPEDVTRDAFDRAICRCFEGLLPTLKPRYAELLRRIDLEGQSKAEVARALRVSPATFDVALHRARQALRRQLEVWCGSCTREQCLACTCDDRTGGSRPAKRAKV